MSLGNKFRYKFSEEGFRQLMRDLRNWFVGYESKIEELEARIKTLEDNQ